MRNVSITWTLPVARESGNPLPIAEIANTELHLSADGGANFGLINTILSTDLQETLIPDVDIGDWVVRLVVVDTNGRRSADLDTLFNVPDETAPLTAMNVMITLT